MRAEGCVTAVIVSYRRPDLLLRCLDSIQLHAPDVNVRVFDNASSASPAVRELSKAFPDVEWTFCEENLGFAKGVNRACEGLNGDILLLNPDAVLLGPLGPLKAILADNPLVAAVGPQTLQDNGQPWDVAHKPYTLLKSIVNHAGYAQRLRGKAWSDLYSHPPLGCELGYITGSCLLIRGAAWREVGPFDERFFLYSEEVDWARRAREAGWQLRLAPELLVRHDALGTVSDSASASVASANYLRSSQLLYIKKYASRWEAVVFAFSLWLMDRLQPSKRTMRPRNQN